MRLALACKINPRTSLCTAPPMHRLRNEANLVCGGAGTLSLPKRGNTKSDAAAVKMVLSSLPNLSA
jgi:hypothetical protein